MTDPVITIDGTAGSGKGAISYRLAKKLGWHFLDSGAIYRALALLYTELVAAEHLSQLDQASLNKEVSLIANLANDLQVEFNQDKVYLLIGKVMRDVSNLIRGEFCANLASKLAIIPEVRQALLNKQRKFQVYPGLIADGRDMGTVVFPEAVLKFFLDADPEIRAKRRYLQLKGSGVNDNLHTHIKELHKRDLRDARRVIAPLKPAEDAIVIDTTTMTIDEVFAIVVNQVKLVV